MLNGLLSLVAPHYCLQCDEVSGLWCDTCRNGVPTVASRCYRCHRLTQDGRTCPACHRVSKLYAVRAATRYEGYPKKLIWKVKFGRAQSGVAPMAKLMVARCQLPDDSVIVATPTGTKRVRQRGYDQAVLLARRLARESGISYVSALERHGQQQQRNASRALRLKQLQDAFVVLRPDQVRGRSVILVDDVITTGATLEAAARALKAAGAKRVSAVVFAQA